MKITRTHVKTVANFVVARSVSGVIVTLCHQNVNAVGKLNNAQLYIGAFALGSMVASSAQDHTEKQIDQIAEIIEQIKNPNAQK